MNDFEMASACTPYGLLACKIVERAVLDWRSSHHGESDTARFRLDELRTFFRGRWCSQLLTVADMDGNEILARLEREQPKRKAGRRNACLVTVDGETTTIGVWCRRLNMEGSYLYNKYRQRGRAYVEEWLTEFKKGRGL